MQGEKSFKRLNNRISAIGASCAKEKLDIVSDSKSLRQAGLSFEADIEPLLKIRDEVAKKRDALNEKGRKAAIRWIEGGNNPLLEFLKADKRLTQKGIDAINASDSILYYDVKAIEDLEDKGFISLHGTGFCDFDGVFTKKGLNLTVNHFSKSNPNLGFADIGYIYGKFDSVLPLLEKYRKSEAPGRDCSENILNNYGIINKALLGRISDYLKQGFLHYYNLDEKNSDLTYCSIVLDTVYQNMKNYNTSPISDSFAYDVFIQSVLGIDVFFFTTLSEHTTAKLLISPLKEVLKGLGQNTEIIVKGTRFYFGSDGKCTDSYVNHGYEKISLFRPLIEKSKSSSFAWLSKPAEEHKCDTPSDSVIFDLQGVSDSQILSKPAAFVKIVTDGASDLAMLELLKQSSGPEDISVYTISMDKWKDELCNLSEKSAPVYIVNDVSKFTKALELEQDAILDMYFIGTSGICRLSEIFSNVLSLNIRNSDLPAIKKTLDDECSRFIKDYPLSYRSKTFNLLDQLRRGITESGKNKYNCLFDINSHLMKSRYFGFDREKIGELKDIDQKLSSDSKRLNMPGYKITGYIPQNAPQFQNNYAHLLDKSLCLGKYFASSAKSLKNTGIAEKLIQSDIKINENSVKTALELYETRFISLERAFNG